MLVDQLRSVFVPVRRGISEPVREDHVVVALQQIRRRVVRRPYRRRIVRDRRYRTHSRCVCDSQQSVRAVIVISGDPHRALLFYRSLGSVQQVHIYPLPVVVLRFVRPYKR